MLVLIKVEWWVKVEHDRNHNNNNIKDFHDTKDANKQHIKQPLDSFFVHNFFLYHVIKFVQDVEGVELCGTLKNVDNLPAY